MLQPIYQPSEVEIAEVWFQCYKMKVLAHSNSTGWEDFSSTNAMLFLSLILFIK
ncbi:unnamed protein product [Larinioides sclopetarius]|uniref:Uncharacterized protein n=1 Tax=Larinioides sclopetarius TaxID=280406 RepID=A0AAV1ZHM6_9ARAC